MGKAFEQCDIKCENFSRIADGYFTLIFIIYISLNFNWDKKKKTNLKACRSSGQLNYFHVEKVVVTLTKSLQTSFANHPIPSSIC